MRDVQPCAGMHANVVLKATSSWGVTPQHSTAVLGMLAALRAALSTTITRAFLSLLIMLFYGLHEGSLLACWPTGCELGGTFAERRRQHRCCLRHPEFFAHASMRGSTAASFDHVNGPCVPAFFMFKTSNNVPHCAALPEGIRWAGRNA